MRLTNTGAERNIKQVLNLKFTAHHLRERGIDITQTFAGRAMERVRYGRFSNNMDFCILWFSVKERMRGERRRCSKGEKDFEVLDDGAWFD